jgi:hypothetical protein
MHRSSYLSRIARVGTESGTSIAPARVLFRPPPPLQVTPVESRSGGDPAEPIRNTTAPSEKAVSARNARAYVSPRSQPTFSSQLPITETVPKMTPGREERPLQHVSGTMLVTGPVFPLSARPALRELAITASAPKVTPGGEELPLRSASGPVLVTWPVFPSSAKPAWRELSSFEPHSGEAGEQARVAGQAWHPKAPARLTKVAVAAFNDDSLDTAEPHPPLKHRLSSAPPSTARQSKFPGAQVLQSFSETSRTILIPPPPVRREPFVDPQGGAERRSSDTGTTVRIGALEVRIMPPSAIAPHPTTTLPRQPVASSPRVALSRGFRSFGLTQT